ncbi:HNH endonuclease [Shewanella sp. 0m-8]
MSICYLSGEPIDEKNKSLEHILPNALGGKLKSEYVVTHKSNQSLNLDIDAKFNKIFESMHQRLGIKKDRAKNSGVKGYNIEFSEDIIFRDNKCYPVKPFYDETNKVLYAKDLKVGNQFAKHISETKLINLSEIKILTDIIGDYQFPFVFDNKVFSRGLAKIAAGYATLKGVSRENLVGIIDFDNCKIKDSIELAPYLPPTNEESLLEENISSSSDYPFHTLALYGNKEERLLYCYIELFSTFQYFIILNDNYDGEEVYYNYFHSLTGNKDVTYQEYLSSVNNIDQIINNMPTEFRRYPRHYVYSMNHNVLTDPDLVRGYTYFKCNTLNAYISYTNMLSKLDKYELSLSEDD